MLAPAGLPVQRPDSKAGSASTVATFPCPVAVPTSWGSSQASVKGTRQGEESWKPGMEVLGNSISECETKRPRAESHSRSVKTMIAF